MNEKKLFPKIAAPCFDCQEKARQAQADIIFCNHHDEQNGVGSICISVEGLSSFWLSYFPIPRKEFEFVVAAMKLGKAIVTLPTPPVDRAGDQLQRIDTND